MHRVRTAAYRTTCLRLTFIHAIAVNATRAAVRIATPRPHLLAVITHQTHETLIEVPVANKTNEIPVAQALVGWVPRPSWRSSVDTGVSNGSLGWRDVVFGEDRSRVRTGAAPRLLSALRNAILTLIGRTHHHAVSATRRRFTCHPRRALALVRPFRSYR